MLNFISFGHGHIKMVPVQLIAQTALTVRTAPQRPVPAVRPGQPGWWQQWPVGPQWPGSPGVEGNRPSSGPRKRNSWVEHPGRSWRWSLQMSVPGPGSLPGDKRNDSMEVAVQLPHKSSSVLTQISCCQWKAYSIRAATGLHLSQISKITDHNVSMQIINLEFPV